MKITQVSCRMAKKIPNPLQKYSSLEVEYSASADLTEDDVTPASGYLVEYVLSGMLEAQNALLSSEKNRLASKKSDSDDIPFP